MPEAFRISCPSLHFPEPPLGGKFDQRGFHLPSIESHAYYVEVGVAPHPFDLVLPLSNTFGQPPQLLPREYPHAAAFDVEDLDPSFRDARHGISEADVRDEEHHVVHGVEQGELADD